VIDVLERHRLVGVDANGQLCACGDKSASLLEHLGAVAVFMFDPDLLNRCQCSRLSEVDGLCARCYEARRAQRRRDDVLWVKDQKRRQNLASYVWPAGGVEELVLMREKETK
jgi:hypothetical protein